MQVELAQTTTSDDIVLDGVLLAPQALPPSAVDAVLLVHGTTRNFYRNLHLQGPYLREAGYAVASFNTRGHD